MKYKLTDECKIHNSSVKLFRIQATKSFGDVAAGSKGGWVQSEANLSQEGLCWIYGEAMCYNHAKVSGAAKIKGEAGIEHYAIVAGNARVLDKAVVSHRAVVSGAAHVHGSAMVCDRAWVTDRVILTDNCRVGGRSRVKGRALITGRSAVNERAVVQGEATLIGDVEVTGDAEVTGSTSLHGQVVVGGNAYLDSRTDYKDYTKFSYPSWVAFNNVGSENGILGVFVTRDAKLQVTRGCFTGSVEEFLEKSLEVHGEPVRTEYKLMIEAAKLRLEHALSKVREAIQNGELAAENDSAVASSPDNEGPMIPAECLPQVTVQDWAEAVEQAAEAIQPQWTDLCTDGNGDTQL